MVIAAARLKVTTAAVVKNQVNTLMYNEKNIRQIIKTFSD